MLSRAKTRGCGSTGQGRERCRGSRGAHITGSRVRPNSTADSGKPSSSSSSSRRHLSSSNSSSANSWATRISTIPSPSTITSNNRAPETLPLNPNSPLSSPNSCGKTPTKSTLPKKKKREENHLLAFQGLRSRTSKVEREREALCVSSNN